MVRRVSGRGAASGKEHAGVVRGLLVGRLLRGCLRAPWLMMGAVVVATFLWSFSLFGLHVSTDGRDLFAKGHVALQQQQELERLFGAEPEIILGLRTAGPDDLYSVDALNLILEVTRQLEVHPGVDAAALLSLATVPSASSTAHGLQVAPPLEVPLRSSADAAAVRERVDHAPLFGGTLVSLDGSSAAIYVPIDPDVDRATVVREVETLWMRETERAAAYSKVALEALVLGSATAETTLGRQVAADLARLLPIVFAVVAIVLWTWFRKLSIVVLGLAQGATVVLWSVGLLAVIGSSINLVTVIMPVILVTYCLADTIHLGSRFVEKRRTMPSQSRRQAMEAALGELVVPVVFTSLSTSVGFLAFAASPIPPLRAFGFATAFGVVCALATSLLVVPAVLLVFGFDHDPRAGRLWSTTREAVERVTLAVYQRPAPSLIVAALIAVLAGAAAVRVQVQDSWVSNLAHASPLARADDWFNRHFYGSNILTVGLKPRSSDGPLAPEFLRSLESLQLRVQGIDAVGGSRSLADQLGAVGHALGKGDDLPESIGEAEERRLLLEMAGDRKMLAPYLSADGSEIRFRLFLNRADYVRTSAVVGEIVAFVAGDGSEQIGEMRLGGDAYLGHVLVGSITDSLLRSLAVALIATFAVTFIMLRRLSISLVAMVPVILGLLWIFGSMGLTRTPLGVATSTFSAMALGVGVDFALHWLGRWRISCHRGEPPWQAVRQAGASAGPGVVVHGVVLLCGFGLLAFSQTPPNRALGLLMCSNLAACAIATVWLLPALTSVQLRGARRSRPWPAVAACDSKP